MDSKTQLSIFTPTYNRGYILPRLYESLCNQTDKDFDWMIIDDGSEDNTKEIIDSWINENKISIKYIYQQNSGKHVAINCAADNCSSKWMCCVDSDDHLTPNAVEVINSVLAEEQNNNYLIGLVGPRGDIRGKQLYDNWPDARYLRFNDLYDKHGFYGETVIILRTDVVQANKFPIFDGEKFVPENVLYGKISILGEFRTLSEIIYCFEYRNDGYSKNGLKSVVRNPQGCMLSYRMDAEGTGTLMKRAKGKAFYDAIRLMLRRKDEPDIKNVTMTMKLMSLAIEPYYVIKLITGINKYKNG